MTHSLPQNRRARFARWRGDRPFWGGLFLVLSGICLLLPPLATVRVGDVLVSISTIAGVSTLLLGSMMLVCAASVLARASARVPAGVAAMLIALVALPAANFGGFVVGTLLGVIGSAAALAWRRPGSAPETDAEPPPAPTEHGRGAS